MKSAGMAECAYGVLLAITLVSLVFGAGYCGRRLGDVHYGRRANCTQP